MKGFIVSIIMLTIAISYTVILSVLGYNASCKLIEKAEYAYSAPIEEHKNAADEISALWDEYRPLFSLSLHKNDWEKTNTIITSISVLTNAEHDPLTYKTVCKLLIEQFILEKDLHKVTFDGVF